ncbi:putative membrane protein [Propionispora sp. 2/2-37]|uniref:ABC transporter permease n=1 Tax=Propionispora sp. 2/2-37 TaxID=1677858 RepID=UPI0006BB58E8|nr:ABC transporter permease [Propionispora sp. 2/2-37]CUH97814.1 putative membrane protein [Propionispora sp. 2/2-37]
MRLFLAWRNLLAKPVQSGLTVLVVAATFAMMIVITLLFGGIHDGLVRATEPFDLLVGAKGSPNQLVLNTVFLQDAPIGNISHEIYEELAANPLVSAAVPLAFGDSYNGYAIVGAGSGIFEHQPKTGQQAWLELAAGRPYRQPFEAVVGAKAARELALKPGDSFQSMHGLIPGGESHEHPYQVVGILQPVYGPYDRAIFVSIESIWQAHEKHGHEPAAEAEAPSADHAHGQEVTAIMVKPKGYSEAMRLYQQFQHQPGAQMVFPAQVIVQLFAVLGQGEQVLKPIACMIVAMGLLIMALSLYWSAVSRLRERAILRALGASSRDMFTIMITEGALLTMAGVAVGGLTGHGLYALVSHALETKTAILLTNSFTAAEGLIILIGVVLGLLTGAIPALLTYRTEVARHL